MRLVRSWRTVFGAIGILGLAVSGVNASPYWIAYEGDDYPENEGWTRYWGDGDGPYSGGAIRSVDNGLLTLDSLHDDQVFDFYYFSRAIDPEPGELFVAEWRVLVDPNSDDVDQGFLVARDAPLGYVFFKFGPSSVRVHFGAAEFSIAEGIFHTYRFVSYDMVDFDFYIDDTWTYSGVFDPLNTIESRVSFGDGVQGERSMASWDYVRFGVVPEPSSGMIALVGMVVAVRLCKRTAC